MSENTGWPGGEYDTYNQHANVKLTQEQLDHIVNSGEPISQWIRQAIQNRINDETGGEDLRDLADKIHRSYGGGGLRSDGEWPK